MSDTTFVMYHGSCMDGYASAWVASQSLGRGPDVIYVPMNYGEPYPPEIDASAARVVILDFSFKRDVMLRLASVCPDVLCLDHHKSAAQELEGLDGAVPSLKIIFNMKKSGAMLAWDYFIAGEATDYWEPEDGPMLIQYIQDRDLWSWNLPHSKEFNAALASHLRTFEKWDWLDDMMETYDGRAKLLTEGSAILRSQDAQIAGLVDNAVFGLVAGICVPVVNTPLYQSEVGNALCLKYPDSPFSAAFFVKLGGPNDSDSLVYSLRSVGDFDVSEVARKMGGGGHRNAAGFVTKGTFRAE